MTGHIMTQCSVFHLGRKGSFPTFSPSLSLSLSLFLKDLSNSEVPDVNSIFDNSEFLSQHVAFCSRQESTQQNSNWSFDFWNWVLFGIS